MRHLPQNKFEYYRYQNFPDIDWFGHRKAVCRRCKCVLNDCEPATAEGEFWHPDTGKKAGKCQNRGKRFGTSDPEIEPFLRKRERRRLKRHKQRA
jgi:hypothetical protein